MAEVRETQAIEDLTSKESSAISNNDTLLVINSSEGGYQATTQNLGDHMIQNARSNLNGKTQTVASAIGEVNGKLPSDNGTNDQILRSNGDGTSRWDNAASASEIGTAVTEWLEENIAGGQTIAIDDSLTVEDAAADAKAVGDALDNLKIATLRDALCDTPTAYTATSDYYIRINELEVGKTYKIGISARTSGNYSVIVCTNNSASTSIAILFPAMTAFTANEMQYVIYSPTVAGAKYLRLSNNTITWDASISEMMQYSEVSEQLETLNQGMIARRGWLISGNVVYDNNEIPVSYGITWTDGTPGTVVMSNFDEDAIEYTTTTATYGTQTVTYQTTYDDNGYVVSESYAVA